MATNTAPTVEHLATARIGEKGQMTVLKFYHGDLELSISDVENRIQSKRRRLGELEDSTATLSRGCIERFMKEGEDLTGQRAVLTAFSAPNIDRL